MMGSIILFAKIFAITS